MNKRLIFVGQNSEISAKKGFTLVELLIVLTILAILGVAIVLVLNPAEILKKSRDSQRMSDLSAMKSAISLYLSTVTNPYLGTTSSETGCKSESTKYVWISLLNHTVASGSNYSSGSTTAVAPTDFTGYVQFGSTTAQLVDGQGWIPVTLTNTTGGAAISAWPIDPASFATNLTGTSSSDRYYRYGCNASDASSNPSTFELDANLESTYYTTEPNNMEANDGGNNEVRYEAGTNLTLLRY